MTNEQAIEASAQAASSASLATVRIVDLIAREVASAPAPARLGLLQGVSLYLEAATGRARDALLAERMAARVAEDAAADKEDWGG